MLTRLPLPALVLALAATFASPAAAQVVQFEQPKSDFVERQPEGQVWVALSQPAAARLTVPFAVIGGTATRGVAAAGETDYLLADGTVTFEAGESEKSLTVSVVDDARTEPVETILILLGAPSTGSLGAKAVHTYSIYDDDALPEEQQQPPPPPPGPHVPPPPPPAPPPPPSTVGFVTVESSGKEGAGTGSMLVRRDGPARAVTVQYRVSGGTASAGQDYTLAAGVLTIPAAEDTAPIVVALLDDALDEVDETLTVVLENPSADVQLGLATSTFTITDDDVVEVSFQQPVSEVDESAGVASTVVRLSAPAARPVTFSILSGGTATGGGVDYSMPLGPFRIEAGLDSLAINLPITNDIEVEVGESADLALTGADGATLGAGARHVLTIRDDDRPLPVVRFAEASSGESEDVGTIEIAVELSAESLDPVTVQFERSGGTTTQGEATVTPGTLTFAPGETRKTIVVQMVDDTVEEADETVEISLSAPTNALVDGVVRHVHWVQDDDSVGEDLVFYRQEILTADADRRLLLIGSKTQSVRVRGLAIDPNGNLYITDEGAGANQGGVLMVMKGQRKVLRILSGLDRPRDIELMPDGRSFVVASASGDLTRRAFGLSVKLLDAGALGPSSRVYAQTNTGVTRAVSVSPDGYFHLPDILTAGQVSDAVTIVVEHHGKTRTYPDVPLGSPGGVPSTPDNPRPVAGHTVIQLQAP